MVVVCVWLSVGRCFSFVVWCFWIGIVDCDLCIVVVFDFL